MAVKRESLKKQLLRNAVGSEADFDGSSFKVATEKWTADSNRSWDAKHNVEDAMIAALDLKADVELVADAIRKLRRQKLTPEGVARALAGTSIVELTRIMMRGESDKTRLDATKHMLALGGLSPTQKHEISRADPEMPKQQLIAQIMGARKDLKAAGIEVMDDDKAEPEGT